MDQVAKKQLADHTDRRTQMETIVAEHQTALLRYACRIVNNPTSAQDVVQNVFIKLFKRWKVGTRPSKQLRGWLYRVTHNEAVDLIRKESRLRALQKGAAKHHALECPDGIHCPEPSMEDRRVMVLEQVRHLKPREQQVILLRLDEGLTYAEIAEVTGRSEGNIGNILHHAVKTLARAVRGGS